PNIPEAYTFVATALVDSAAPYVVIPYSVHGSQHLRIHQGFGERPYRILSEHGEPHLQPFVEVGVRFLAKQPDGAFAYWPAHFVRVRAYLLDQATRPKKTVLVGAHALLENFVTHLQKQKSFLTGADP